MPLIRTGSISFIGLLVASCLPMNADNKNKCESQSDCLNGYVCRGRICEPKPSATDTCPGMNGCDDPMDTCTASDNSNRGSDTTEDTAEDTVSETMTDTVDATVTGTDTVSETMTDTVDATVTGTDTTSETATDNFDAPSTDTVTENGPSKDSGVETDTDTDRETDKDTDSTYRETDSVDPCIPNPCQNDGSCIRSNDTFRCSCINGWKGDLCETCGRPDAGPEICDQVDNDCDGTVDEGFDLTSDPENCGGCGNNCATEGSLWADFGNCVPLNVARFDCRSSKCGVAECNGGYGDDSTTPTKDCNVSVKQIVIGDPHTCELLTNGLVYCWGANDIGQLGADTGNQSESAVPVLVDNLTDVQSISSRNSHTCALLDDNTVKCWGDNDFYQLGSYTESSSSQRPQSVEDLSSVKSVGVGKDFSCALLEDNSVKCWGKNKYGLLGENADENGKDYSITPLPVAGISTAQQLYVGGFHACVILDDDSVACWGRNNHGQLGKDVGIQSASPVQPPLTSGAVTLGIGGHHTCVLLDNGEVYCWGYNSNSQIGVDAEVVGVDVYTPTKVEGLSAVSSLGLGTYHSCAVIDDGTVSCWGSNAYGYLGADIGIGDSPSPVTVTGITSATHGGFGIWHGCMILNDGRPRCWGRNHRGQLGNGQNGVNPVFIPVEVIGLVQK